MLHLLPQYQKRKIVSEYRLRMLSVIFFSLSAVAGIFAISLLPSYVFLSYEAKSLKNEKAGYEHILSQTGGAHEGSQMSDTSAVLASLMPFEKSLEPLLFVDALGNGGAGIRIDGYAFTQSKPGEVVPVVLSGLASTRESLNTFAQVLDKNIGGVKVPLSALVKPGNIPFEFRFQMSYDKAVGLVGDQATLKAKVDAVKGVQSEGSVR